MTERVLIVQGHPDERERHFCHGLADAYADGASAAGYTVERIEVAELDFDLLRRKADWSSNNPPPDIRACQDKLARADHLVLFYPLWLGTMPALLKGFLEQLLRPDFAFGRGGDHWRPRLGGRSARVVVTMGMPAVVYRWYFGAHSLRSLERNILGFCGIGPVRESLIGLVEGGARSRRKWLERMRRLGRAAR